MILQLVRYLTNYVVAKVPSYTVRHLWYRRILGVQIGEKSSLQMELYFYVQGLRGVNRHSISIGRNTIINRQCCLDGRGGLRIGDNVSISPGVWLLTKGHDMNDPLFPETPARIEIGDYAWLGSRALLLPGVIIGEGAVVAAGAIVTKDVAPYTVVAGSPARPIGSRSCDLRYQLNYQPRLE